MEFYSLICALILLASNLFELLVANEAKVKKLIIQQYNGNVCQKTINDWQQKYKLMKTTTYAFEIDDVISVAMGMALMLPTYIFRLNAISAECRLATNIFDKIHDDWTMANKPLGLSNRTITESQSESPVNLIDSLKTKYGLNRHENMSNASDTNNYFQTFSMIQFNQTRVMHRLAYMIQVRKTIDALKQQQHEVQKQTIELIRDTLKKLLNTFPILNYFLRLIEVQTNTNLDSKSTGFLDLKIFMHKLSKNVHDNLRSLMIKLPAFNENELEYKYRNAKYTILFMNKLFEFIEPLVNFDVMKFNFSNYLYESYADSDLKVQNLCDVEISNHVLHANRFCTWLSIIITHYYEITRNHNDKILYETYKYFKQKI
jgi:hypothetical protein